MPISLLMTVIVMSMMGFSLNIMTLGGLVIAIGMMVDSSSVVIESCFRAKTGYRIFQKQRCRVRRGSSIHRGIYDYNRCCLSPLCFSGGMTGQIFMQLGLTIVFSMVASLISAITLVPLFFKLYKPTQKKELRLNVFLDKIKEKYDHVDRKLLHKKKTCLLTAVLLLVASFWILSMTNIVSMPTMDEGMISVTATFRPGTRVEVVNEQIVQIEDLVAAVEKWKAIR